MSAPPPPLALTHLHRGCEDPGYGATRNQCPATAVAPPGAVGGGESGLGSGSQHQNNTLDVGSRVRVRGRCGDR